MQPTRDAVKLADEARRSLRALPRIDAPHVRAVRRRYSKAMATTHPGVVVRFVKSLLHHGTWADRVVAYEVLATHKEAFATVDDRFADEMAKGLADWASVDLYGVTLVGQAWRAGQVTDARILSWTRSPDRWLRRLALVATVPLNLRSRGGGGDTARTLRVCRSALGDSDDMVVKALSWSLRELAKRDPEAVEAFLLKEEERLAPRVRREVRNKLRTGRKSPRRTR